VEPQHLQSIEQPEDVVDPLIVHRIHFGFTIIFHYLFPQLTMGLALLIVVLKTVAIRTKNPLY
jgi:cytochrome bd ubiquinol oxidase subunit I